MFSKSGSSLKQMILNLFSEKSKFNIFLDLLIIILFGLLMASIPIFSFQSSGKIVTWILTILLFGTILLSWVLYYDIKIDIISISLFLFSISSIISSALTGFLAFKITAPLLAIVSCVLYTYSKSNKKIIGIMFLSAFLGTVIFLLVFVLKYRAELLTFNFDRLGRLFGDNNDVALFLAFGLTCSIYFTFFRKNLVLNIVSFILIPIFIYCGCTTGSKIFILIILLCLIAYPILFFGKKRWWLAPIFIIVLTGIFIGILNLPFLSSIKNRMLDFISTLFGKSINQGDTGELSTINRFNMFCCGMEMFMRRPMFGWGIWGFATFGGRSGGWSHNNISESFCNFGLIGTVLFHFGFFVSIKDYIKSKSKKSLVLPFVLILFYLVAMLSVALNSQKLYAYVIGLCFANICNCKDLYSISVYEKLRFKNDK